MILAIVNGVLSRKTKGVPYQAVIAVQPMTPNSSGDRSSMQNEAAPILFSESRTSLFPSLWEALQSVDLWSYLAWHDIKIKYRRSKLGPFWITLSMAVFCLSLGVVYSQLFRSEISEYLPFLSVGFVVWGFMAACLGDFPNLFVDNASFIKDIRINLLTVLLRVMTRNIIVFFHHVIIIVAIYAYFGIPTTWNLLLAIPGVVLVTLNLAALGVSLSIVGARFRDVGPITQSVIQILFFISPITWFPKLVPADSWVLVANPFAYYLDLVRSPLLGNGPMMLSWVVASVTLVVFMIAASWIFDKKANRVVFWV
jgi:ABC-type polysaccharide/polyol phosphate export permease